MLPVRMLLSSPYFLNTHTHTHTGMAACPVSASSAASAAEVVECHHRLIDSNILILPVTLGSRPLLSSPALPRDCNNLKTPSRMHTCVWGQAPDTPISVIGSLCHGFNCNSMLINTTRRAGDPVEPSRLNSMNHHSGKKKIQPWLFLSATGLPNTSANHRLTDFLNVPVWYCIPVIPTAVNGDGTGAKIAWTLPDRSAVVQPRGRCFDRMSPSPQMTATTTLPGAWFGRSTWRRGPPVTPVHLLANWRVIIPPQLKRRR